MKERANFSVHDSPKKSPGFLLWHVSTSWRGRIEAVLKTLGLTHPQFVILAATGWLTRHGELTTQAAIGKMAGLDPNTTSQIIRGLEQKKLVQRDKSSDKRANHVSVTPDGADLLRRAMPAVETADAQFFSILAKQESDHFLDCLQKLTESRIALS